MRAGLGVAPDYPLGTLHRTHLLSARGPNRAQGVRPMFHRAGGAGLGKPWGLWVDEALARSAEELLERHS